MVWGLFCTHSSHLENKCSCGQEGVCTVFSCVPFILFPGLGGSSDSHLYQSIVTYLLQCTLHESALEEHLEVSTGPEFSGVGKDGDALGWPYTSPALQATLVAIVLWVEF